MQLLSGGFAEAAVLQRQGDCRALEANAERGEARRGGGNSDWRDERRAGGRREGVDGTGETRTVEVLYVVIPGGTPGVSTSGSVRRLVTVSVLCVL